jgi:hypothetical protein
VTKKQEAYEIVSLVVQGDREVGDSQGTITRPGLAPPACRRRRVRVAEGNSAIQPVSFACLQRRYSSPQSPIAWKRSFERADIANLIPPIINGTDALQDPLAAVKFDKRDLKLRIENLRDLIRASGREVGSVAIGGFVLASLSRDKAAADAALRATASSMGYPSEGAARNSPTLLFGTRRR